MRLGWKNLGKGGLDEEKKLEVHMTRMRKWGECGSDEKIKECGLGEKCIRMWIGWRLWLG